jgi:hypothetical protein
MEIFYNFTGKCQPNTATFFRYFQFLFQTDKAKFYKYKNGQVNERMCERVNEYSQVEI